MPTLLPDGAGIARGFLEDGEVAAAILSDGILRTESSKFSGTGSGTVMKTRLKEFDEALRQLEEQMKKEYQKEI